MLNAQEWQYHRQHADSQRGQQGDPTSTQQQQTAGCKPHKGRVPRSRFSARQSPNKGAAAAAGSAEAAADGAGQQQLGAEDVVEQGLVHLPENCQESGWGGGEEEPPLAAEGVSPISDLGLTTAATIAYFSSGADDSSNELGQTERSTYDGQLYL